MLLFWIALSIYLIGAFFIGIGALVEYSCAYDERDRLRGARMLISIPVWPLYWGKRLIILIAEAIELTREKENK